MTELRVVEGERPETLTDVVARRLRGQLAERRIKKTDVIELTGWGKTTVYRKLKGETPLDTDQLDTLWRLFGISPAFLLTGRNEPPSGPGHDGGGGSRPGESNPRPIHYRSRRSRGNRLTIPGQVIPLRPDEDREDRQDKVA